MTRSASGRFQVPARFGDIRLQDVSGARVMVRADFGLTPGELSERARGRVLAALPGLRRLMDAGAAVQLVAHCGRPAGNDADPALSLAPLAGFLSSRLQRPVPLIRDWIEGASTGAGEAAVLENVRFLPGEIEGDPELGRRMARLCDVFVLDAFSLASLSHASVLEAARSSPGLCVGPLFLRELAALSWALDRPERPLAALLGGDDLESGLAMAAGLPPRLDMLLFHGELAMLFLAASGHGGLRARYPAGLVARAELVLAEAARSDCLTRLPGDVFTRPRGAAGGSPRLEVRDVRRLGPGDEVLDIGPNSAMRYADAFEKARTVVWMGTPGRSREPRLAMGSRFLAQALADSGVFAVAGGEAALSILDERGPVNGVSLCFPGGQTLAAHLKGGPHPVLDVLRQRAPQGGLAASAAPLVLSGREAASQREGEMPCSFP